jgi:hypothetical protein
LSIRKSEFVRSLISFAVVAALLLGTFASDASAAPTIRLRRDGIDRFKFHGRVRLDPPTLGGPLDPAVEAFAVELRNQLGMIYQASLFPGDLVPQPNLYYRFSDRAARRGAGERSGLFQVITRFRKYRDGWYYTMRIMAYADLSSATEPRMTVAFPELPRMPSVTADWVPTRYGWRLPLDHF